MKTHLFFSSSLWDVLEQKQRSITNKFQQSTEIKLKGVTCSRLRHAQRIRIEIVLSRLGARQKDKGTRVMAWHPRFVASTRVVSRIGRYVITGAHLFP